MKIKKRLENIYNGKKIFITGHTGFKGSWLIKIFDILGAQTTGYSLKPKNEFDLINCFNELCNHNSVIGDIRDLEKLNSSIKEFKPDFIFHLAAQPIVRYSYKNPIETYETNVMGTLNLLESVKNLSNPCSLIMITTDKVYKNTESIYPHREDDKLGGYDPYSSSKACSELLIASYRDSFFNIENYNLHKKAIAVARAGNIIGGGDWSEDRLIPDLASSLYNKQKLIIRSPNSVRPWQHVIDALIGYLILGEKLSLNPNKFSQEYNFGPYANNTYTVKNILDKFVNLWGDGDYIIEEKLDKMHETNKLILDISKSTSDLDWKPLITTDKAIELTADWYKKAYKDQTIIEKITENQIMTYL